MTEPSSPLHDCIPTALTQALTTKTQAEGGQLAAKAALVHALREETSHDTVLCMLAEAIHQLAQKDAR